MWCTGRHPYMDYKDAPHSNTFSEMLRSAQREHRTANTVLARSSMFATTVITAKPGVGGCTMPSEGLRNREKADGLFMYARNIRVDR